MHWIDRRSLRNLDFLTLSFRLRVDSVTLDWQSLDFTMVLHAAMNQFLPPVPAQFPQIVLPPTLPTIRGMHLLVDVLQAFLDPQLSEYDPADLVTLHAYPHETSVVVEITGSYLTFLSGIPQVWPGSPRDTAQHLLAAHGSPLQSTSLGKQVRLQFTLPVVEAGELGV